MVLTDTRSTAELLLEALVCGNSGCRCQVSLRRGRGRTHCPVHQDVIPSFGVDVKNNQLLVYCYGGCKQPDVIEALKSRNLWPETKGDAKYGQDIVAEYDYRDEKGELLYQSVRLVPKDFKQRRPDPRSKGKWIWKLDNIERVLYRLPELIEAIKQGKKVIFVVEGEKDVDRLRALGLTATCNVGGAGKWRSEYNRHFKAQIVCVVVDNDDAGRTHALDVARNLIPVAERVLWLELPELDEHGDVSDWLDDNQSDVGELQQLVRRAPLAKDKIDSFGLKVETVFKREGLAWRFEPAQAPMVFIFSRIVDHRDEITTEVHVTRSEQHVVRRRLNLLAGGRGSMSDFAKELAENYDELDDKAWKRIVGEGAELVLEAHRNGIEVEVVEGEIEQPPPPRWLCDGLLLKDKPNCWLAAASTGKSTLAKAFCAYYASGFRFLNRETEQGIPLYLDWEDDKESFDRVVYEVCRNLGVWPLPRMLWMNMRGRRLRDQVEKIGRTIDKYRVGFLVIDAIAAAGGSPGEHSSWESVALDLEESMGQLPPVTVLGLDHVTSDEHKNGDRVPLKARGAERKVEFFRNQWSLMIDKDARERGRHLVDWTHTKINLLTQRQPFVTELVHRPGDLSITELGIESSPSAIERLPMIKRYYLQLLRTPGLTVTELADAVRRNTSRSQVESTRSELKRAADRGLVRQEEDGKWYAIPQADEEAEKKAQANGQQPALVGDGMQTNGSPWWTGDRNEPGKDLPW